jgi:hypothetical protein
MIDPARELVWPWDRHWVSYYTSYNRILRDAGIPVNRKTKTHGLRCTHATVKAVLGGDPSRALGHSDRATTERFYIDPQMLPNDETPMPIPWRQPMVPMVPSQTLAEPEPKRRSIAAAVDETSWL